MICLSITDTAISLLCNYRKFHKFKSRNIASIVRHSIPVIESKRLMAIIKGQLEIKKVILLLLEYQSCNRNEDDSQRN